MAPPTRHSERGFTLIELLIVLLILSILAAIGIPKFLSQRAKAQDASAKTAARVVAETLHVFEQDHETFLGADRDELVRIEPKIAELTGVVIDADDTGFEVSVDSTSADAGGGPFIIEYDAGRTERTCEQPGEGGCPPGGHW
jgi:prepilin-type N-terminal cleavage/methylation domain-containing protein